MLTVFSENHRLHHGTELKDGKLAPSFENPHRADTVLAHVAQVGLGKVIDARTYERACYEAVHSERYVRFLETAWSQWVQTGRTHDALPLIWPVRDMANAPEPQFIDGKLGFYAMDAGSPITATTWVAVRSSADVALTAVDALNEGLGASFGLCRPPGHHAAREYMGGYCYLNNAAIAAQRCIHRGAKRVAVIDVDFHHGNGTQNIFYERDDVLFVSLHGEPGVSYPYFSGHAVETGIGRGEGFTLNYPLPKGTEWSGYEPTLAHACRKIREYGPEALIVSLGVDTFEGDPISHFRLASDDFLRMGARLAEVNVPTTFLMEGGYMVDEIGINAVNVLCGFKQASR